MQGEDKQVPLSRALAMFTIAQFMIGLLMFLQIQDARDSGFLAPIEPLQQSLQQVTITSQFPHVSSASSQAGVEPQSGGETVEGDIGEAGGINAGNACVQPAPREPQPIAVFKRVDCPLVTAVWSRGISRSCCDIHPEVFQGEQLGSMGFTHNVLRSQEGRKYYTHKGVPDGTSIYVPMFNFAHFLLSVFLKLPMDTKIVLVVGQEDGGIGEWFGWSSRLEFRRNMPISLEQFLGDQRLGHLFVQNFDIVRCHTAYFSRDGECKEFHAGDPLLKKVSAIPIGLNFHSQFEQAQPPTRACLWQVEMEEILAGLPPWKDRELRMLGSFAAAAHRIDAFTAPGIENHPGLSRQDTWRKMGEFAFAAAPNGHGLDTHRFWEILFFESIPVTITSPLDTLYTEFPCIIVQSWSEASRENFPKWKEQLIARFGPEVFSKEIRHRLTNGYWAGRVQQISDMIKRGIPV